MAHVFTQRRAEQTNAWKGMGASYTAKHHWLLNNFKKTGKCEKCEKRRKTQWSNISGKYLRERSDYRELCVPCHKKVDFGDSCKRGHRLTEQNCYRRKDRPDSRICKKCHRMRVKNYQNNK